MSADAEKQLFTNGREFRERAMLMKFRFAVISIKFEDNGVYLLLLPRCCMWPGIMTPLINFDREQFTA